MMKSRWRLDLDQKGMLEKPSNLVKFVKFGSRIPLFKTCNHHDGYCSLGGEGMTHPMFFKRTSHLQLEAAFFLHLDVEYFDALEQ